MKIPILCPYWGHEYISIGIFLEKVHAVGYDGIDTWIPKSASDKRILSKYLQQHNLYFVAHQHQAKGSTFQKFRSSFLKNLIACLDFNPVLINSHTGRDYFTKEQNLTLIEDSLEFSARYGVKICHETHRGRFGYAPMVMDEYFSLNEHFELTADFSHWVCVTESMLENFVKPLNEAIKRSRCIHARIGFQQGPQIGDPTDPIWKDELQIFLNWWDKIVKINVELKTKILPITTEFGPQPYMANIPFTNKPLYNQFQINCYMKDLLKTRYSDYSISSDNR